MKKCGTNRIIKSIILLVLLTTLTHKSALASCGLKYEPLPREAVNLSVEENPYTKKRTYLVKIVLPKEYQGYPIFNLVFYGVIGEYKGYDVETDLALNKDKKNYNSWLQVTEEFIEGSYIEFEYVYKEHKLCPRYYRKVYLKEALANYQKHKEQ